MSRPNQQTKVPSLGAIVILVVVDVFVVVDVVVVVDDHDYVGGPDPNNKPRYLILTIFCDIVVVVVGCVDGDHVMLAALTVHGYANVSVTILVDQ